MDYFLNEKGWQDGVGGGGTVQRVSAFVHDVHIDVFANMYDGYFLTTSRLTNKLRDSDQHRAVRTRLLEGKRGGT